MPTSRRMNEDFSNMPRCRFQGKQRKLQSQASEEQIIFVDTGGNYSTYDESALKCADILGKRLVKYYGTPTCEIPRHNNEKELETLRLAGLEPILYGLDKSGNLHHPDDLQKARDDWHDEYSGEWGKQTRADWGDRFESTSSMAIAGPPTPMGKPVNARDFIDTLSGKKRKKDRLDEDSKTLYKQSQIVSNKVESVGKFLKRKRLGITGDAMVAVAHEIKRMGENRTTITELHLAESVLLEFAASMAASFYKAGRIMERKDFHDFCQDGRQVITILGKRLTEIDKESRRLKKSQLKMDDKEKLKIEKYLRNIRQWTDLLEEKMSSLLEQYV